VIRVSGGLSISVSQITICRLATTVDSPLHDPGASTAVEQADHRVDAECAPSVRPYRTQPRMPRVTKERGVISRPGQQDLFGLAAAGGGDRPDIAVGLRGALAQTPGEGGPALLSRLRTVPTGIPQMAAICSYVATLVK
jgi:hypothetical protein